MDLADLFSRVAVVLVGIIAVTGLLGFWNQSYNTTAGSSFENTIATVQTSVYGDLGDVAVASGQNTQVPPGPGEEDQEQSLITRSMSTLRQIGAFFGIVPSLISDGAQLLGVPETIANIGAWVFIFGLAVTLGLIFLQVVWRR